MKYKFSIGLLKSLKNVFITVGIPAIVVLINNYLEWMPKEWYSVAVPVMSMISYLIKNYVQVKKE